MVDFESETTITRPASDVCKIVILQRRYDCIEALGDLWKREAHGSTAGMGVAWAALKKLAKEVRAMLGQRLQGYDDLVRGVTMDAQSLEVLFDAIDAELYDLGLTKIDTGKRYDRTRTERENAEKGL